MKRNTVVKFLAVGLSSISLFHLSEDDIVANASDNEKSNSAITSLENVVLPLEESEVSDNLRNATTVTSRLRNELRDLAFNLNNNAFLNKEILYNELLSPNNNWSQLDPSNLKDTAFVRVNNDMILKNGDTLAAHDAKLSNDTGIQQTLSTASFTYTQIDSVTTSTTHSAGVSLTTSAEMKFPFISGSMSMTAKYDFSTTNAVQSTLEKKWEVPSQNIIVPAGRHYQVNWVLNTGVATGTTNLISSVNANVPYKMVSPNVKQVWLLGDAIARQDSLVATMPSTQYKWGARNDWERVSSTNALRKWGTSKYTAQFGTELIMRITDVTNARSSPVIVQEIPMNVIPEIVE